MSSYEEEQILAAADREIALYQREAEVAQSDNVALQSAYDALNEKHQSLQRKYDELCRSISGHLEAAIALHGQHSALAQVLILLEGQYFPPAPQEADDA